VNSVGVIPRRLPFTASNSSIRTFRHAISLDEHRAKFKANVYNLLTAKEAKLGTKKGEMPKAGVVMSKKQEDTTSAVKETTKGRIMPEAENQQNRINGNGKKPGQFHREKKLRTYEAEFDAHEKTILDTDVLEVWFAGCHTGAYQLDFLSHHFLTFVVFEFAYSWICTPDYRCGGRLCLELQSTQSRTHTSALDDTPVFSG
jgi:uncharacterized protein (DUF2235 family)